MLITNNLLYRFNIINSPNCVCGEVEDRKNILCHCTVYYVARMELLEATAPDLLTEELFLDYKSNYHKKQKALENFLTSVD